MAQIKRRCWLTFEGGCQDQPCIWEMSRKHPAVVFDIRQAKVGKDMGVMALEFEGDEDEVLAAFDDLRSKGVRVDPVEGGDLVAG